VPYAIVEDIAASWERYAATSGAIVNPAPAGLILYAAGATDEGIRIIGVWEDAGSWERFRVERLAPAVAALQEPMLPPPTLRELEAAQLVVGGAVSERSRQSRTASN
jgi:hypothetical protein